MAELTSTTKTNLVFLGEREYKKTPESRPVTFITLGCDDTYKRFEFIADKECAKNFQHKTPVVPVFELDNYNNRANTILKQLHLRK